MVKIVTDSTSDIPADIAKKLGISMVPLTSSSAPRATGMALT